MVVEQVITLGNIIVIGIVIIGAVASTLISISSISAKTAVFVAATEMKFTAGEKKFVAIDKDIEALQNKCNICPQKVRLEDLLKKTDGMNNEQIKLRAQLPIQLGNIEQSMTDLKSDISELRKDLALSKII